MLKKTITYNDLDGNPVTEDFYFNLNKAEIAEMELSHDGGFSTHLERLIEAKNGGEIISAFKSIITSAIGRRSEDGRRFVKSQEIIDEFLQTEAYSQLFMDLIQNEDAAAEFVKGIVPEDMAKELSSGSSTTDTQPAYIREKRDPTKQELQAMSKDELLEAMRRKNLKSVE